MKFCSQCGEKIVDEAVICVHCGCQVGGLNSTQNTIEEETKDLWKIAWIYAFIMPPIGIILGIVGACTYKKPENVSKSVRAIIYSICFPLMCYSFIKLFISLAALA